MFSAGYLVGPGISRVMHLFEPPQDFVVTAVFLEPEPDPIAKLLSLTTLPMDSDLHSGHDMSTFSLLLKNNFSKVLLHSRHLNSYMGIIDSSIKSE